MKLIILLFKNFIDFMGFIDADAPIFVVVRAPYAEAIFNEFLMLFFFTKNSFIKQARKLSPAPKLSIDFTLKEST